MKRLFILLILLLISSPAFAETTIFPDSGPIGIEITITGEGFGKFVSTKNSVVLFGKSPALVVAAAAAWGISVIADSAQFSAAVSELAEPNRVGSALALQTAVGFLLTAVSIQIVPAVVRGAHWSQAFGVLAVGPALGTVAMVRLHGRPEAVRLAGGRR